MRKFRAVATACAFAILASAGPALAGEEGGKPAFADQWPKDAVSTGRVSIQGKAIDYKATAGTLSIKGAEGAERGRMFYVAYVADVPKGARPRPVTFVYNGGPGSSSIWLHMGSFAPIKAVARYPAPTPSRDFGWVPNGDSLLDKTDLVFIDAMSTGYSRAPDAASVKTFMGIDQDAQSFSEAIRAYLDKADRWLSPKYLMGESYGATRSAVASYKLQQMGVELDGIVLISSILNFGDLAPGIDRQAINLLPTVAAVAHAHGKAGAGKDLDAFVAEARAFAEGPYTAALAKGHNLDLGEQARVAQELSKLTGLSPEYLQRVNLRVETSRFRRELLRDKGLTVGELDGAALGVDADGAGERSEFDPAEITNGATIAAFNSYLARGLGYRPDLTYRPIDDHMFEVWDWSHQPPTGDKQISMADVALDLAAAMRRNPRLRVLSINGYHDMVTPFFATEHDLAHMNLPRPLVSNIQIRNYPAGHMLYLTPGILPRLKADIGAFYGSDIAP
jgi:carboxypeptidase C (cathepsin A)